MRQYPEAIPLIIVDSDTDPTVAMRIESFNNSIHQNPDSFIKALNALDIESTDPTLSVSEQIILPRTISTDISRQIIDFFIERDDLNSSYDEVTEKLIKSDEFHQKLLANVRATKESPVRVGHENLIAVEARDAVRRSRLRLYLGQVVSFHAKQQSESLEVKESILINS